MLALFPYGKITYTDFFTHLMNHIIKIPIKKSLALTFLFKNFLLYIHNVKIRDG